MYCNTSSTNTVQSKWCVYEWPHSVLLKLCKSSKPIIMKVSNCFKGSVMHITRRKVCFLIYEMFEVTTPFSQYKAETIFHVFVDFVRSILVNTFNCLRDFSP